MPKNNDINDLSENKNSDESFDNAELNIVKKNNYQRANTAQEAFKNKQGNKNFYKDKQKENNNRLEAAKKRQQEAKMKVSENKNNKKDESTKNKLKDSKKRVANGLLGNSKNKEEKEQNKKDKKELKESNKELKEAKQERKDIIRDNIKSKAYELTHPLEAMKQRAKKKIIKIAIVGFLLFFIAEFIIAAILNFISVALEGLDNAATGVANIHEKTDNFFNGFGFRNSEDAFYHELNHLNEEHDGQLEVPLLISTIFYDDIHSRGDIGAEDETIDDLDGDSGAMGLALARRWVKEKVKESKYTIGEDGLAYSSNKIYRLRKLARNQFDNPVFGKGSNKIEHEVTISEYLNVVKNNIDTELLDWLKENIVSLEQILNPAGVAESLYEWLVAGDETFFTTDTGASIENLKDELTELLDAIFSPFFDIEKVTIGGSCGGIICVKYNTYGYSEETYDEYLRKHYIPSMPEFRKYISSKDETIRSKEINDIIREIHLLAEEYEDIYGVKKKSTENYNNTCTGNIKESLLGDLKKPVDISGTVSFSGKYAFGISEGTSHKGLDLNNTTAGVGEGTDVYSVYNHGVVLESTKDKTYSDKKANGGWLKIKYTNTSGNEAYDFTITYGGLDPESITLSKNSTVNSGDVIGKIGSKDHSEDKVMPSLHFGFYDNISKTYLDPTNLFIPCSSDATGADMLIHDIYSISETNFVEAVNNYCASHSCKQELKSWDLHVVYKAAVSNNFNPKVVVLRAIDEGFAPHTRCNNYNYWGINVTNEGGGCGTSYSSLADGVKGLATLRISQNNETLGDFMSTYAYIGAYWYNTSADNRENTGLGGCYYYPYIKKYMSESRSNEVANACVSGKWCYKYGNGTCLKSIDEDQKAYTKWLCEKMEANDEAIFGAYRQTTSSGSYSGASGSFGDVSNLSSSQILNKLFPSGVPTSESGLSQYLTTIDVPITTKSGVKTTTSVTVHKDVAKDLQDILKEAQDGGFKVYQIGGYSYRKMNNGTSNLSHHSYGIAVDINVNENYSNKNGKIYAGDFWNPSSSEYSIPTNGVLVNAFKKRGWKWGGDWSGGYKDYMHFSLTGN